MDVLNERRRRAVKLRLSGMKLVEAAAQTELSVPTVIAAHKAYLSGGWDAVAVKPRGRGVGDGRMLSPQQEIEIRRLICSAAPDRHGVRCALWDREAVAALVEQRLGPALPASTLAHYLTRWGFVLQRQARPDPGVCSAETRRWLTTVYPAIVERAKSEGAEIHWGWERALPPDAVAGGEHGSQNSNASRRAAARRGGLSLVAAATNRRKLRWLVCTSPLTAPSLIEFFDRLVGEIGRKVFLVLNNLNLDRVEAVRAWLEDHSRQIEVFYLPAPAPTADSAIPSRSSDRRVREMNRHRPAPRIARKDERIARSSPERHSENIEHLVEQYAERNADTAKGGRSEMTLIKKSTLTHLQRLEAESIHIMREVVAEAENPVMLYSIGKDSAVMLHLAMKAFCPAKPPFPLLHVDTTWKFRDMYAFRDNMAKQLGLDLIVHVNPEGLEMNINPFVHGSAIHTDIMKTQGLKQALDKYGFDAAFGGARRDEEKSRAKERVFSFRSAQHRWDPKNQRPELWRLYNARKHKGESIRVFPLSNWTELDIWQYIYLQNIPIVPLYFAKTRPVVERDGTLIMVDDDRMALHDGEIPMMRKVRFRTLGCYPLTGAVESEADTLPAIIQEMLLTKTSERQGRVIDHDSAASMEEKKQEGYF